jgi:hypothetical protein
MYYNDHAPPHFHVRYGEHRALIGINPVALLAGRLPRRALSMIFEWVALHQGEVTGGLGFGQTVGTIEELKRTEPLE